MALWTTEIKYQVFECLVEDSIEIVKDKHAETILTKKNIIQFSRDTGSTKNAGILEEKTRKKKKTKILDGTLR